MSWWLLSALAVAGEWRAAMGAELNADSHGVADLGYRSSAWSLQLLTDTLDLRYAPEHDRGRWWLAARGEAAIAELLPFPWADGAPVPEQGYAASYAGIEGGWLRYLPGGLYAGAQGMARQYGFSALEATRVAVPASTHRLRAEGILGWWTPVAQVYAVAGAQHTTDGLAPHANVAARVRPDGRLVPVGGVWLGWGANQDALTRTRMGGLNPYVVPLAGAGWAEWWVEDYAVLRAGPGTRLGPVQLDLVGDVGWSDASGLAWGVGLLSRTQPDQKRWFVELSAGYGAGVERAPGVSPVSVWFLLGRDWGSFRSAGADGSPARARAS